MEPNLKLTGETQDFISNYLEKLIRKHEIKRSLREKRMEYLAKPDMPMREKTPTAKSIKWSLHSSPFYTHITKLEKIQIQLKERVTTNESVLKLTKEEKLRADKAVESLKVLIADLKKVL